MLPARLRAALLVSFLCPAATLAPADAATLRFKSELIIAEWSATISGTLILPNGAGPFPTVVFLHPCAGITKPVRESLNAHAGVLKRNGFAVLLLDSFSARKLNGGKACGGPLARMAAGILADDAFNAMKALRKNDKIDADNFFLVGQSLGATGAVRAATKLYSPNDQAFRAIAAWYPGCHILSGGREIKSPLIIFGGGKDDWTPVDPCRQAKVKGAAYEVIVYPNALHAFDQPRKRYRYKGHTLGYDARATADARAKMVGFFKQHLKK